jgi:type IV pilus assembly protein PilN
MIKINLLPVRAEKKRETIRQQIIIAAVVLVLTFVVIGFLHSSISSKISDTEAKVVETKGKIAHLKSIIGEVDKFKETKKDLEQKLEVIEALENNRLGPVLLMDELSRAMPERCWFESLTESSSKIKVKGKALDTNNVAALMDNLNRSEMFTDVVLKQTSLGTMDTYQVVDFELTFTAKGLAPPVPTTGGGGSKKKGKRGR